MGQVRAQPRSRADLAKLGLVAGAGLLLAACGSTVQTQAQLSATSGSPGGQPAADGGAAGVGSGVGSGIGPAAGAGSTSVAGEQSPADLAAAPAPGSGGPVGIYRDGAGLAQGLGVTATSIYIGIGDVENADAANQAVGAGKVTQGDQKGETQALIDDINAHGGVGGRKLVAVWHTYDAQSTNTGEANGQAACADYTQDHKVFAVLDSGPDNLQACLTKVGVLQVFTGDIIRADRQYFRTYPHYMDLGTMSQDRMMSDEARSLVRQSYFSGWDDALAAPSTAKAKLGILSLDTPEWNRPLDHVLLPALRKIGYPVAASDIYRIHNPNSSAEISNSVAQVQNAALRFRNDGVTHVVMLDANGSLTLFFTQNTKSQHYYPRLAVNSGTGMQALYDTGVVDSNQVKGAVGIGWAPMIDLPAGEGEKVLTKAATSCLALLVRHGFTFSSTNAKNIALAMCDDLHFLRDAINAAGHSITLSTVQTVIDSMGARFDPAYVPATFFSPARHDGAELAFDMKWDDACSCTKYVDSGHRVG